MFIGYSNDKVIDRYLDRFYLLYKEDMNSLVESIFREEDLYDRSKKQYKLNQYYYTFQLVALIYMEYIKGFQTDWNYYITKYNLLNFSKFLQCSKISLKTVLSIFELPTELNLTPMISNASVGENLEIGNELDEETEIDIEEVDSILDLVNVRYEYISILERNCDCIMYENIGILSEDEVPLEDMIYNPLLGTRIRLTTCNNNCL